MCVAGAGKVIVVKLLTRNTLTGRMDSDVKC